MMDKQAINNAQFEHMRRKLSTAKGRIAVQQACWDPLPRFVMYGDNRRNYMPPPLGIVEVQDEEVLEMATEG
jgi:hypothetical protein